MKMLKSRTSLVLSDWGVLDYKLAFDRQERLVSQYLHGDCQDTLILVEHPPTVTLGRRATAEDLHFADTFFAEKGVALQKINRGGLATAHEPGQLVVYPIVRLKQKDVRWYADSFLQVVIRVLADLDLEGELKTGEPGVWVNGRKICSFGIALKKWVSMHGVAVNINNSLETFNLIVPCGRPEEVVTSVRHELGHQVDLRFVKESFVRHFCSMFDYEIASHPVLQED